MTATGIITTDRQQSTDSGWDNPFRPGGDLSREADEIVNMIKGGKSITPTETSHSTNGMTLKTDFVDGQPTEEVTTKTNVTQVQSVRNGTTIRQVETKEVNSGSNGNTTTHAQISKEVILGPTSASHVVIGDKNKKKGCCVLQ